MTEKRGGKRYSALIEFRGEVGMIDIKRRGFLVGATAALILPPVRTFHLLPPIKFGAIHLSIRHDMGPPTAPVWQAYRIIEWMDNLYDVTARGSTAEAARAAIENFDTRRLRL